MDEEEKKRLDYLRDGRSREEYHSDINRRQTGRETEAMRIFAKIMGWGPEDYEDLRPEEGGVKTENYKDIGADPDFKTPKGLLEVKVKSGHYEKLWLKRSNFRRYARQGAGVLIVMGWNTDAPTYTVIDPRVVTSRGYPTKICYDKKICYIVPSHDFKWEPFIEPGKEPDKTDKKLTLEDFL